MLTYGKLRNTEFNCILPFLISQLGTPSQRGVGQLKKLWSRPPGIMSFAGRPGQGEVDKGKVKRYRPGQAPDWIKEEDAEASASDEEMKEVSFAAFCTCGAACRRY